MALGISPNNLNKISQVYLSKISEHHKKDADGNTFGMPVMDNFKKLQTMFKEMQGWVGKEATFTYFERTKAGSYRHPLFKAIRNYE